MVQVALNDDSISLIDAISPTPYKKWALAIGTLVFLVVAVLALTGNDDLKPLSAVAIPTGQLKDTQILVAAEADAARQASAASASAASASAAEPRAKAHPGPRRRTVPVTVPRKTTTAVPSPRPAPAPKATVDPVLGF